MRILLGLRTPFRRAPRPENATRICPRSTGSRSVPRADVHHDAGVGVDADFLRADVHAENDAIAEVLEVDLAEVSFRHALGGRIRIGERDRRLREEVLAVVERAGLVVGAVVEDEAARATDRARREDEGQGGGDREGCEYEPALHVLLLVPGVPKLAPRRETVMRVRERSLIFLSCDHNENRAMRVLMVEDDVKMAGLVRRGLEEDGHAADLASSGEDAVWMAQAHPYDAIVLDVMLPGLSGFETCKRLRNAGVWSPVLMLTARDSVDDRVAGLDAGADDYLTKPFSFAELLARLRAVARRGGVERPAELTVGDLRLDPATRRTWRGETEVQ